MDFLATYMAEQIDGGLLAKELEALLGCHVGLSKNLEGSDIQVNRGTGGEVELLCDNTPLAMAYKGYMPESSSKVQNQQIV